MFTLYCWGFSGFWGLGLSGFWFDFAGGLVYLGGVLSGGLVSVFRVWIWVGLVFCFLGVVLCCVLRCVFVVWVELVGWCSLFAFGCGSCDSLSLWVLP